MERLMGVEPTSEAWEASILPMNYSRICYVVLYSVAQTKEKIKGNFDKTFFEYSHTKTLKHY